ncbi:hypothetical protein GCM10008018_57260 [Paenibacillus marchantiophytorum]|uniref:Uncharacterized protein n=1 Tax=Paenibacillus marchantiophytorum TaxID=1619310 RepID=A0ABQ1FA09_9BACL|nr:hypothetical protein [Paenibacillus marchantiophytorum]GGA03896.1 hypothetical protein GCM10008018_57260 [Paenibacillus marchantiophytorum]
MSVWRSLTLKFSVTVGVSKLCPEFGCVKVVFQPYGVTEGRLAFVNAEIQRYGDASKSQSALCNGYL